MSGDRKYQRMPPYQFSGVRGFFFAAAGWIIMSIWMSRLCDPFGIASQQASAQRMSCGRVLCSYSSRYYRRRRFKYLGLCFFSQSKSCLLEYQRMCLLLVTTFPSDRLLTETDAPFTRVNDRSTAPSDVKATVETLACTAARQARRYGANDKFKSAENAICRRGATRSLRSVEGKQFYSLIHKES